MTTEYFKIKDNCRAGLIKYLEKALSVIPKIDNPEILDIGCGTGVPTLWLADKYSGSITAIDTEVNSLDWLQKKAGNRYPAGRLKIFNISFFDLKSETESFDLILAEGFLNIVGFETGFPKVIKLLKRNRYLIIHDEFKEHDKKCEFIRDNNCRIIDSQYLDEDIWWNDYYRMLEIEINNPANNQIHSFFESDKKEIEYYKRDPSPFRSIYYIIEKL